MTVRGWQKMAWIFPLCHRDGRAGAFAIRCTAPSPAESGGNRAAWVDDSSEFKAGKIYSDSRVDALLSRQMGGRKRYNLRYKGRKGYGPVVSLQEETRRLVAGRLRNIDWLAGMQIARLLRCLMGSGNCFDQVVMDPL